MKEENRMKDLIKIAKKVLEDEKREHPEFYPEYIPEYGLIAYMDALMPPETYKKIVNISEEEINEICKKKFGNR